MMQLSAAQVTEDQLRWALAFATVECPELGVPDSLHGVVNNFSCQQCSGTGRVYALEGVRRECPGYNFLGVCAAQEVGSGKSIGKRQGDNVVELTESERWRIAQECGGGCRGYGEVPVEGLEAWLNAATALHDTYSICHVAFSGHGPCRLEDCDGDLVAAGGGENRQQALLRALTHALGDQGARLAWEEA